MYEYRFQLLGSIATYLFVLLQLRQQQDDFQLSFPINSFMMVY